MTEERSPKQGPLGDFNRLEELMYINDNTNNTLVYAGEDFSKLPENMSSVALRKYWTRKIVDSGVPLTPKFKVKAKAILKAPVISKIIDERPVAEEYSGNDYNVRSLLGLERLADEEEEMYIPTKYKNSIEAAAALAMTKSKIEEEIAKKLDIEANNDLGLRIDELEYNQVLNNLKKLEEDAMNQDAVFKRLYEEENKDQRLILEKEKKADERLVGSSGISISPPTASETQNVLDELDELLREYDKDFAEYGAEYYETKDADDGEGTTDIPFTERSLNRLNRQRSREGMTEDEKMSLDIINNILTYTKRASEERKAFQKAGEHTPQESSEFDARIKQYNDNVKKFREVMRRGPPYILPEGLELDMSHVPVPAEEVSSEGGSDGSVALTAEDEDEGGMTVNPQNVDGEAIIVPAGPFVPKYHLIPITFMYGSAKTPNWDYSLVRAIEALDMSKEEINQYIDLILAAYGPRILVPKRLSDGDRVELNEVLQLMYSTERTMQIGNRARKAVMSVGDLVRFEQALSGPTTTPPADPNQITPPDDVEGALAKTTNAPGAIQAVSNPTVFVKENMYLSTQDRLLAVRGFDPNLGRYLIEYSSEDNY